MGNDRFLVSELGTRVVISDSGGLETLDFSAAAMGVKTDLSRNSAQAVFVGNPNTLTLTGRIENVLGTSWDDEIRGNAAANRIEGNSGDDAIYGGGGNDYLSGGEGDDRLYGESGNDVILGGPGNDSLSAGAGRNILIGGEGEDTLRGARGEEILIGGTTSYDGNREALFAILAQWNSESFRDRVHRLWSGFTHPALGLLQLRDDTTVRDDAARDLFFGGRGSDWFLSFPDGNVYGGAYQNMHLFRYDPGTRELTDLGNHSPRWSGETYSFSLRGGELVAASYVNGGVVLYDPARPWQAGSDEEANPRFVGTFGQYVYRPYATTATSDGRIWGVGAAGWGTAGGGIAWLDPDSGRTESRRLSDTPWTIAEIDPATLLVASEGRLRWWDQKTNRELASASYPRGCVSDVVLLRAGPQPLIAFCDAAGLHVASLPRPGRLQVIESFPCPVLCAKMFLEGGRLIVGGPTGIAELDPNRGRWVVLSHAATSRWGFAVTPDAVYFTRGAELLTLSRPQRPLDTSG